MTPADPLVLAFGDSLIAGYGLAGADGFTGQLERRLRAGHPDAHVINAGVSGSTTADALRRLPAVLSGLAARPHLAVVQIGPNDVLRSIPPGQTRANLDAILQEFARCGIPVLLTEVAPPAFLHGRTQTYQAIHAEVAARHGIATHPFFPAGVLGHPEMVLRDRIHPNARAIAAVVAHLLPAVEAALNAQVLTR